MSVAKKISIVSCITILFIIFFLIISKKYFSTSYFEKVLNCSLGIITSCFVSLITALCTYFTERKIYESKLKRFLIKKHNFLLDNEYADNKLFCDMEEFYILSEYYSPFYKKGKLFISKEIFKRLYEKYTLGTDNATLLDLIHKFNCSVKRWK